MAGKKNTHQQTNKCIAVERQTHVFARHANAHCSTTSLMLCRASCRPGPVSKAGCADGHKRLYGFAMKERKGRESQRKLNNWAVLAVWVLWAGTSSAAPAMFGTAAIMEPIGVDSTVDPNPVICPDLASEQPLQQKRDCIHVQPNGLQSAGDPPWFGHSDAAAQGVCSGVEASRLTSVHDDRKVHAARAEGSASKQHMHVIACTASAVLAGACAICAAFTCTWVFICRLNTRCDAAEAVAAAREQKVEALCETLRAAVARGVPALCEDRVRTGPDAGAGTSAVDAVVPSDMTAHAGAGRVAVSLGSVGGLGVDIGAHVAPDAPYLAQLFFGAARWFYGPPTV